MAINIDIPKYGIAVNQDQENKLFGTLMVETSSVRLEFFLFRSDNYQDVARKLHDKIMQAGKDMKRAESGLVVAEGPLPNGFLKSEGRPKQGQKGGQ